MEDPAVPPSDQLRFRARLWTRWVDEDAQQVLNNAVYMTLLEEGRHRYFGELGLLLGNDFPFLLARTSIAYLRPGRGGREVELELATVRLGTSSFEQVYRLREVASQEVWCEARALLVTYDPETGEKRPMEPSFRARVAEFEGL